MRRWIPLIVAEAVLLAKAAFGTDSSVPFINADVVHAQGITGQGVTVAMIDTGIYYEHPGLAGSIAGGGISFEGGIPYYDGGADIYGYGHGTYMSLIVTDSSGVAPDAEILSVRVFGPFGADPTDVVLGINYARNRRQVDPSIRVINLSLGGGSYSCSCDNDGAVNGALANAVAAANSTGIVTFAATGNEMQCGYICSPACVSGAVRVAAEYDGNYNVTWMDPPGCGDFSDEYRVTCFSNIAEYCDWFLAAPGYDISVGGFSSHGTSQATAHCSGVAALMYSKAVGCDMSGWTARQIIWWSAYPTASSTSCPLPWQPEAVNAFFAVNDTSAPCIRGDMNCDLSVDFDDISPFVRALVSQEGYEATYPTCRWLNGDIDGNGQVDFDDINPFVRCLVYAGCP
jgi:hypothetical protein